MKFEKHLKSIFFEREALTVLPLQGAWIVETKHASAIYVRQGCALPLSLPRSLYGSDLKFPIRSDDAVDRTSAATRWRHAKLAVLSIVAKLSLQWERKGVYSLSQHVKISGSQPFCLDDPVSNTKMRGPSHKM